MTEFCETDWHGNATALKRREWRVEDDHIPRAELRRRIVAAPDENAELAHALELVSCDQFICDAHVRKVRRQRCAVDLKIKARIAQNCVVTLIPFARDISENVTVDFWPLEQIEAWDAQKGLETQIDEGGGNPEPIVNGEINLGRLVYETLAVVIDPHPRNPHAEFDWEGAQSSGEPDMPKPFASLESLKTSDVE